MSVPTDRFGASSLDAAQLTRIAQQFGLGRVRAGGVTRHGRSDSTFAFDTEQGAFVLRLDPDADRLRREGIHAALISDRTPLAAAVPYRIDDSCTTVPTPLAVMPRLPGMALAEPALWQRLDPTGRANLTHAFGASLATLHRLAATHPGVFTGADGRLDPFPRGYAAWRAERLGTLIAHWQTCEPPPAEEDVAWAQAILRTAMPHLETAFTPVFVHNDYTLANVIAQSSGGQLRITGAVDLVEGYFGLGEADLVRSIAMFGLDRPERVQGFLRGYLAERDLLPGHQERFVLYMLEDRLSVWLANRAQPASPGAYSFRAYAERYLRMRPFDDLR